MRGLTCSREFASRRACRWVCALCGTQSPLASAGDGRRYGRHSGDLPELHHELIEFTVSRAETRVTRTDEGDEVPEVVGPKVSV